jgi:DNA repair photolyase
MSGPGRGVPIRGRGTAINPPNRFDRIVYEEDLEAVDPDAPKPRTELFRDASRSILARNESPDVGFDVSINPYRGCEHGCVYCLGQDTPVLYADMQWRPIGAVRPGHELVGFDEWPAPGRTRKFRKATVRAVRWSRSPTLRVTTANSELLATANHGWLQAHSFRWSCTHRLGPGRLVRSLPISQSGPIDDDYRVGYVCGLSLGDGTFRYEPGGRSDKLGDPPARWRVALADNEPLLRTVEYLRCLGVETAIRPFSEGFDVRRPMNKVETRSLAKLGRMHALLAIELDGESYARGFLAGFFDAEGHAADSLRISQVDLGVLERVRRYARRVGFEFRLEPRSGCARTIRLVGRFIERFRFFTVCQPAIRRKMDSVFGIEMNLDPEIVQSVEPGPVTDVVDIETSTATFCAGGLATHNCFARPTHETLGFSSGLDFETKILVKPDAPRLLRAELSRPSWKPQVIALSGVTDPYQPIERALKLTRSCLEVLAEFRNPVLIVTKNQLVARDRDLLGDLARRDAAGVCISVTTLDGALQRAMEPRASPPERRLEAIRALAEAGVPVGVLVAPVIPGLTDHEMPAILDAAARCGARFAGYVPLRLPYAVKDLFEYWLCDHFPDRKEKILGRIRSLRGGRLNDPDFGSRLRGGGIFAEEIRALFTLGRRRSGLRERSIELSTKAFRRPGGSQLALW